MRHWFPALLSFTLTLEAAPVASAEPADPISVEPLVGEGGRRTGRAVAELSALIGTGTVIHYSKRENNRSKFVYPPTWDGLKGKIRGGWEFDTNTFVVNSLGHVYDGVLYYQIGRSNGFGPLGSLGFSFGGSLLWEYVGEFTDRVSANDMIVTGVAGAVLGEGFHQTSLLVERSGLPQPVKLPLSILFDPIRKLNEWWDAKPRPIDR
ncbi:MAG: DUF3943 domain-containing protein [Nitrospirae bacterium]|nr:DUF3943 domain-containing protein [Nitrospirota bacterium]